LILVWWSAASYDPVTVAAYEDDLGSVGVSDRDVLVRATVS